MLVFFLACTTTAPPAPVADPEPVVPEQTVTVRVPSDCPHIIIDIISAERSDVTVACFGRYSGRTYLQSHEDVAIGVLVDPTRQDRLLVEFVERSKIQSDTVEADR